MEVRPLPEPRYRFPFGFPCHSPGEMSSAGDSWIFRIQDTDEIVNRGRTSLPDHATMTVSERFHPIMTGTAAPRDLFLSET